METQSYLLSSLHGLLYGINTLQVREIILLPELAPAISAPRSVVGVINLRDRIVPIIDLDLHFGCQPDAYKLSDCIIFLEHQGALIGIIVNQVHDVKNIDAACIDEKLTYHSTRDAQVLLISGIAKIDGSLVTLLNAENLFQSIALPSILTQNLPHSDPHPTEIGLQIALRSHISLDEQAILHDRACNLTRHTEVQGLSGLLPFAVLDINNEYFGIDMTAVREFTEVGKVTPIPCCPDHIVGNINLRGEIVTLLSLHHILSVPQPKNKKAVVVNVEDIVAGITVDEVLDVAYIHPSSVQPLPAAVHAKSQNYSKGVAFYQGRLMTILNLSKFLLQAEFAVNEAM